MQVRICPECDSEFRAHVERCSDCGVALVDAAPEPDENDEGDEGAARERAVPAMPDRLPPGDYVALVHRDSAAELDPLAERLAQLGVPYRVDVRPGYMFELRVRRQDVDQARAGLAPLLTPADAPPDAYDDAAEAGAYARCPACDTPLAAGAHECAECGLKLGSEAPPCASCGSELDAASGRCPRCEAPGPLAD